MAALQEAIVSERERANAAASALALLDRELHSASQELSAAKCDNASLESRCGALEKDLASARALVIDAQQRALKSASAQEKQQAEQLAKLQQELSLKEQRLALKESIIQTTTQQLHKALKTDKDLQAMVALVEHLCMQREKDQEERARELARARSDRLDFEKRLSDAHEQHRLQALQVDEEREQERQEWRRVQEQELTARRTLEASVSSHGELARGWEKEREMERARERERERDKGLHRQALAEAQAKTESALRERQEAMVAAAAAQDELKLLLSQRVQAQILKSARCSELDICMQHRISEHIYRYMHNTSYISIDICMQHRIFLTYL